MSDQLKKQLEKIKKLLNLAQSSNPNESALALSRAQSLMKKNGISLGDVQLSEVGSTNACINCLNPPQWVIRLVDAIDASFGTTSVIATCYTNWKRSGAVKFIGLTPNDEIAAYCFDVLYRQLLASRKAFIAALHKNCKKSTKTARADWYCLGWVSQVAAKVKPFVVSAEQKGLVKRWKEENLSLTSYKPREAKEDNRFADSYMQGRSDASGVTLHAGMNGQESAKLGFQ